MKHFFFSFLMLRDCKPQQERIVFIEIKRPCQRLLIQFMVVYMIITHSLCLVQITMLLFRIPFH